MTPSEAIILAEEEIACHIQGRLDAKNLEHIIEICEIAFQDPLAKRGFVRETREIGASGTKPMEFFIRTNVLVALCHANDPGSSRAYAEDAKMRRLLISALLQQKDCGSLVPGQYFQICCSLVKSAWAKVLEWADS